MSGTVQWQSYFGGGTGSFVAPPTIPGQVPVVDTVPGSTYAMAWPTQIQPTEILYHFALNANTVFSLGTPVVGQAQRITMVIDQTGSAGFACTLPTGVKWPGNITPTPNTLTGKTDVFYFLSSGVPGEAIQGSY